MSALEYGDGVTTDGDRVYVATYASVARFDPSTVAFTTVSAPAQGHLAVSEGGLWLASSFTRVVEERDPGSLDVRRSQPLAADMTPTAGGADWEPAVIVTADAVWIRSYLDDAVIRLDRNDRG